MFLGQTVASGADVYGSYEDMIIDIAGPEPASSYCPAYCSLVPAADSRSAGSTPG